MERQARVEGRKQQEESQRQITQQRVEAWGPATKEASL